MVEMPAPIITKTPRHAYLGVGPNKINKTCQINLFRITVQSYPQPPALMQLCQKGEYCILWWEREWLDSLQEINEKMLCLLSDSLSNSQFISLSLTQTGNPKQYELLCQMQINMGRPILAFRPPERGCKSSALIDCVLGINEMWWKSRW